MWLLMLLTSADVEITHPASSSQVVPSGGSTIAETTAGLKNLMMNDYQRVWGEACYPVVVRQPEPIDVKAIREKTGMSQ